MAGEPAVISLSDLEYTVTQPYARNEKGEWIQAPEKDFVILGLIAKLLRTAPDPVNVIKSIQLYNDKKTNWDTEPGFFIPPEELDDM